jgi:hypothetical protein
VSYRDLEDQKNYDFEIDLKKIDVSFPENIDKVIKITDKSGIVMKYPTAEIYTDQTFLKSEGEESFYRLIVRCIDQIYDEDNVYPGKDFDEEALLEFLEYMDIPSFDKVRSFMLNLPSVYYKIEYKNSLGNDRSIELKNLSDFFTLR